jgi:hypothetical protein
MPVVLQIVTFRLLSGFVLFVQMVTLRLSL